MTYIERDVRQILNVKKDLATFQRFVRMNASRAGQLLNLSNLGNDCGISQSTVKTCLCVLEDSYICIYTPTSLQEFRKESFKDP